MCNHLRLPHSSYLPTPDVPSQREEEEQQEAADENRGKETDEEPFWYTAAGKGRQKWLNLDENFIKGRVHLP